MSKGRVLVTGGAGFIGSHFADRLLRAGYQVRVLDALLPQVHPDGVPAYLNHDLELQVGDVRDADAVRKALRGCDLLVHFAAAVGVGQSMYEIRHFSSVNTMGAASVLEELERCPERPRRMLVASSMSIYGEGAYRCSACGSQVPRPRGAEQLARRDWAMHCPACDQAMEPQPTPESKPIVPTSIYAIGKRDHEEMFLVMGRSLGIPTIAMRFFNVYGDRQALSNPYTGVAAIFSSALLNRHRPLVFEDGLQARDFVHVSDVAEACLLALESTAGDEVFNVGTGTPTDLLTLFDLLRREIPGAMELEPKILGQFREGDIRTCYADIEKARRLLGYRPRVPIATGVRGLAVWVREQSARSLSGRALDELRARQLVR